MGTSFSKTLETTLHRALEIAASRHHEYATLEHLLSALIEDEDAAQAMEACAVDLAELAAAVSHYLDTELELMRTEKDDDPSPTSGFQRVVQRAIIHVQSSGREEVTGVNVLIALFSERESYAVYFLQQQDLSRLDVVSYNSHGVGKAAAVPEPGNYDFFVSYATQDEVVAREIVAILSEEGYSTLAQFRDFRPGMNFVREMQRGLAASGRVVAVLSPAYERSDHCQAEWSAAYAQDPGSVRGRIVPLLIAPTQLNPLARQIVYKSLVGLNAAERKAAVLDAINAVPRRRTRVEVRHQAAVVASPDVRIRNARVDAVPNAGTDVPAGRGELVDLVKTLRELVGVALDQIPVNAPGVVRNCLGRYGKHLRERRTQPIVGLLDNLMSPVRKEYLAIDVIMWGAGIADLMETIFKRHEELHGHFPRSDARERFFGDTPIDEEKAVGDALSRPVMAASDALRRMSEAGVTTPDFDDVVSGQEEQARDLASLPPAAASDAAGVPTAKNRFILSQIGFYERVLAATAAAASIAVIPAVQSAGAVLEGAIAQLLSLLL